MSGRRAAWICAELTAEAQRRLAAAGAEADRDALHRLFWPLAKQLAASQKWLAKTAGWYEAALAGAEQDALACVSAIDAVAPPCEEAPGEEAVVQSAEALRALDPVEWAERIAREAVA